MTPAELRRFARLGAEARLRDLQREVQAIHATFPDLRPGRSRQTPPAVPSGNRAEPAVRRRRRRPKMSPEARERIAAAQRKRWAEWKAKQGTKSETAASAAGVSRKKK